MEHHRLQKNLPRRERVSPTLLLGPQKFRRTRRRKLKTKSPNKKRTPLQLHKVPPTIQAHPLVPHPLVGGANARPVDVSRLDMRIGRILSVRKHPDADTLYVEESGWSLVYYVTAASLSRPLVQLM